tara:strand:+ start:959 stop:1162 length:204 start_codon:yes stop_codon:yes gene_type:complete
MKIQLGDFQMSLKQTYLKPDDHNKLQVIAKRSGVKVEQVISVLLNDPIDRIAQKVKTEKNQELNKWK